MTYDDALNFIHSANKFGIKLGLDNIRELLKRLGNPDKDLKFIHIAGTNGKGTVTSTVASVLMCQGYKVGKYISPFVHIFNERISVNEQMISNDSLVKHTARVKKACSEMVSDGFTHPTEFEIVTAIGLSYFSAEKCDFVALEVGMGGRLDATNVIDPPLVSVITSISFDHTEYLGDTLPQIAAEKCGIIKKGSRVAVYPAQEKEVIQVIAQKCQEVGAEMIIASAPRVLKSDIKETIFDFEEFKGLKLHLLGEHMVQNVATAICACKLLRESGVKISDEAIIKGVDSVRWAGRFEVIAENPLMIIDGAHNISGAAALKGAVLDLLSDKKKIFIMGMLRDKEYEKSLEMLAPLCDKLITVTVPSPRTLGAQELKECALKYAKNVYAAETLCDAAQMALENADENTAIVAFGSLYMIGEMKNKLIKKGM